MSKAAEVQEYASVQYEAVSTLDLDYHWNEFGDIHLMDEALDDMGFPEVKNLMKLCRVDYEVFCDLDDRTITDIFSGYPVGLRRKFEMRYQKWKKNLIGNVDRDVEKGVVQNILISQEDSLAFFQNINRDEPLTENDRRTLRNYILSHYLAKKIRLTNKDFEKISVDIQELFPKESKLSYFDPKTRTGPLYFDFYNKVKRLREANLYPKFNKSSKKRKLDDELPSTSGNDSVPLIQIGSASQSNEFVKVVTSETTLIELKEHWKKSSEIRLNKIRNLTTTEKLTNIISEYSPLKRSDGYFLIDMDFQALHPNVSNSFTDVFLKYHVQLHDVLEKQLKNQQMKTLLKADTFNSLNDDQKLATLITALHHELFIRKGTKESILDTVKYMLCLTETTNIDVLIENRRDLVAKMKLTLQPFIIANGQDPSKISGPYTLVLDSIKYTFNSLFLAIEHLLKIYRVFNLAWPKPNFPVFVFLDELFCNLNQESHPKVNALLKQLK